MTAGSLGPDFDYRRYWLPVVVPFVGYPALWLVGLSAIAWPLGAALAVALWLIRRDVRVKIPSLIGLWLAFLVWVLLSVIAIDDSARIMAYAYRLIMYSSATIFFFYVYSMPKHLLPTRVVIKTLAAFWVAIAVGGIVGVVAPSLDFATPVERLLPSSLLSNGLVFNLVHVQFAAESRFLGYSVGRPEALFPFTNAWGSNFAITLPALFAAGAVSMSWRRWAQPLLVLSVIPVIFSLNRGMWLTIVVGLVWAAVQLLRTGRRGPVVGLLVTAGVIGVLAGALGLGSVLEDRAATGHSDGGRLSLYTQAVDAAVESPLIGYGAPVPNQDEIGGPSVGTHGQFWLVLVSQGVPGAVLFIAFIVVSVVATRRWTTEEGIWLRTSLVIVLSQLLIYEQLASQMQVFMVVLALILREQASSHDEQQISVSGASGREVVFT